MCIQAHGSKGLPHGRARFSELSVPKTLAAAPASSVTDSVLAAASFVAYFDTNCLRTHSSTLLDRDPKRSGEYLQPEGIKLIEVVAELQGFCSEVFAEPSWKHWPRVHEMRPVPRSCERSHFSPIGPRA